MATVRRLLPLLPGILILAGAAGARSLLVDLDGASRARVELVPVGIALLGLTLSLWFHRSRIFYALAVLGGIYAIPFVFRPPSPETADALVAGIGILVPLNLGLVATARERGVLTPSAFLRLGFLGFQLLVLAAALHVDTSGLGRPLRESWLLAGDLRWTALSPGAASLFLAAGLWLLLRLLRDGQPQDGGFLGALAATGLVLHAGADWATTVAFWGAGGGVLTVALLQESYRLAFVDELTGLPGRRALEEQLQRLGGSYAIAMIDVDHFKRFNDTHGHQVGDQVLRMVAARIREADGGGRAFRFGGEEFTLVFPGKGVSEARPHLDALRKVVAGSAFRVRGKDRPADGAGPAMRAGRRGRKVTVTVSIGVAEHNDRHPGPGAVLRAADAALYRAKRAGRNRVRR